MCHASKDGLENEGEFVVEPVFDDTTGMSPPGLIQVNLRSENGFVLANPVLEFALPE